LPSPSHNAGAAVARALFALAILFGCLAAPGAVSAQDMEITEEELPLGEGREEVEIYCASCHSLKIVTQQGLDREGWEEVLDLMVEDMNMEELPPEDRKLVLDYLANNINIEHWRAMRKR
jgi:hypothetical protein